ncbi:uncharacterized protein LOC21394528 isoform X1 [Morus notabilis]|nr:uncharacterized protein LOC21394528 isoform X1 [Morus notabilis]
MLHKAPSLSVFNNQIPDGFEEVKDVNVKKDQISSGKEVLERTVTIGEAINEAVNCDGGDKDFSFGEKGMGLIEEEEGEEELEEVVNGGIQNLGFGGEVERKIGSPPLCLDSGIGIGGVGLDLDLANLNEGRDIMEMEEYYKRMVERCPFHPLFLRNYAQFLQSKGDLHGAEEYYSRASLADPEDGEIWMQYAKLVWDLHRDQERASSYFKLATEVSPQDCSVLAAYASFLWEIEDDEEEVSQTESINELGLRVAGGVRIGEPDSFTDVSRRSENLEDHYRKMIKENPNNPLFLRNYAKFLSESKADLQGAEEYYLRAVLADPGDGEITAEYAKLVWELHHDSHKASIYFERAVQASPENCHVLAAYASFLWQNDDDEEDGLRQENRVQVPRNHERTMTAANV